jgi:hypothetical protein
MARACTVCTHPSREAIDRALVASEAQRALADRYGLSEAAVRRHAASHLPAALARAQQAADVASADSLLARLRALLDRADEQYTIARGIVGKAVAGGDLRAASSALAAGNGAIREARGCLELLLEVEGEIDRRAQVNILATPEFAAVIAALFTALSPYADARVAAAAALQALEAAP